MARSNHRNRSGHRDAPHVASEPSLAVRPSSYYVDLLRSIEDRRVFHPEPIAPARVFSGPKARITLRPPAPAKVKRSVRARNVQKMQQGLIPAMPREQHAFTNPNEVMICLRRKIRREVLHALKMKRSGRGRKKRRNYHSDVRC